jgi:alpha-tubulin suppressor-like RCC1 family protein
MDNGRVKCWGDNSSGQLGLGDTLQRGGNTGLPIGSLPEVDLGAGRTVVELRCGGEHSCARLDNGDIKCWGRNGSGQLGLGNVTDRGNVPNQMGDALPAVLLK